MIVVYVLTLAALPAICLQMRYKRKQALILDSLNELRDDILSDIEMTIDGFVSGGKRVER